MNPMTIYGKPTCPHTKRALAAYPDARFVDIQASPANLEEMLQYTDGLEKIPVLVQDGQVTIGYNRGS